MNYLIVDKLWLLTLRSKLDDARRLEGPAQEEALDSAARSITELLADYEEQAAAIAWIGAPLGLR